MSRVKHLFAVVLAALMLCLLMPIAAFAEEASDGKMIVYAKLPSDWSAPHLWAWAAAGANAYYASTGGKKNAFISMRLTLRVRPVTTSWKAKTLGSR